MEPGSRVISSYQQAFPQDEEGAGRTLPRVLLHDPGQGTRGGPGGGRAGGFDFSAPGFADVTITTSVTWTWRYYF
jgi:hypothetical protein